ncbi:MAG: hypothetical protein JSS72_09840 [Armatimonadetes bacterium]|nr:hypothetical protein [Armatimonadota bacterium]
MKRINFRTVIVAFILFCHSALMMAFLACGLLTSNWGPFHIERLSSSIGVKLIAKDGLHLDDGRVLMLPGFVELPENSKVLAAATARGVEINPDGRVYGLIKVRRTCGNDSTMYDVSRVDLGYALEALGMGKPSRPLPKRGRALDYCRDVYRNGGWDDLSFEMYTWYKEYRLGKWPP